MRYINPNQIHEALKVAAKEGKRRNRQRNFLIIKTLSESGLRVTELIELTSNNINFDEAIFHIKGKGQKIRVVDVPQELCQLLQLYVESNKIKSKERIFPLTRDAIRKITWKYGGANPHAFRHTYAINLLRKTKNIRYVQKQLGHTSLNTTEIYLQFLEYEQEKKKINTLYD